MNFPGGAEGGQGGNFEGENPEPQSGGTLPLVLGVLGGLVVVVVVVVGGVCLYRRRYRPVATSEA